MGREELEEIGFSLAAYPLTLLSAATRAMNAALDRIGSGESVDDLILGFDQLKSVVGFDENKFLEEEFNSERSASEIGEL